MQCIMALSTRLAGPDNTPVVIMNLSDQYPTMELQGTVPEVMKRILTAYDSVSILCIVLLCAGTSKSQPFSYGLL